MKREPNTTPTLEDRIIGCFLGGAVGDALGEPVEYLSASEREARWGPQGVRTYVHEGWGRFTDDTQMALFTAEALILHAQNPHTTQAAPLLVSLHKAYLRWLRTQEMPSRIPESVFREEGFLLDEVSLYQRMGPGRTCITALAQASQLALPAFNNSKGCGGLMRVAPIGCWAALAPAGWNALETLQIASAAAQLTHGHPCGYLSAGAFAVILRALCLGRSMVDAVLQAGHLLSDLGETGQATFNALELAQRLAAKGTSWKEAVPMMGEGWVAEEILAIVAFLGLTGENFEDSILLAANHPGDADSVGAIAGNLLGALWGMRRIPPMWIKQLEAVEVVQRVITPFLRME